jgi:hypothetical protein
MKPQKLRVSLAFANGTDNLLAATAATVIADLYPNAELPLPPVTEAILETGITAFATSRAAQGQGGTLATAVKNERREELVTLLESLAAYVQVASNNNLAVLLSSGFQPVSTNRAQAQLDQPAVVRINPGMSGQSLVTLSAVSNSRCLELQVALIGEDGVQGPFVNVGLFTSSRNIPVNNQLPGRMYAYQGRAIGGLTGYSDWSDVVTHRAA